MLERIFRYKRIWLLLLAPFAFLLTLMAKVENGWVESVYGEYIYPVLSGAFGWLLSLAPFSVLEILIILCGLGLLVYIGWVIARAVRRPDWKNRLWRLGLNLLGGASVLYFLFVLCMGLNYYRDPIADKMDLKMQSSNKEELYDLCELLVYDCNFYRAQLQEDERGVAMLQTEDFTATSAAAKEAYARLEKEVPALEAVDIRNKPLLTSKLFSRVLTTGIYLPFESAINVDAPAHTIPATMCHELSHYRGVMRENEANFLGYLACIKSERADFAYSGSLTAFAYAFDALYQEDQELARKIAQLCGEGMLRDLRAEDAYWAPFRDTPISNASQEIYDGYLQANGQSAGIGSYGEMVDLLLAYYRGHKSA